MGCIQSSDRPPKTEEELQHEGVEQFLKEEHVKALMSFKVLLLGAGESGKSTVIKQLKVLHKVEPDQQEMLNYKITLHNNTVTSMQVFIEAAQKFGYQFTDSEAGLARKVLDFNFESEEKTMSSDLGEAIATLWASEAIKKTVPRRSEFWNLDASDYYFDNVQRFCEEDFVPTEEDMIMARVRTTGIVVTEFDEGPVHFSVVDVAGQRSERKKWIHCFDDVKALIFVVSLAGYDQVLFEDSTQNRMQEALNLFQQISNNPLFSTTPIFLFLNKKDLFEKMIQERDLSKCFPEYSGGPDVKAALKFIQTEFEKRMEDEDGSGSSKKRLHTHYIAARYKRDIKYTWEELKNVLLEENKRDVKEATKKGKNAKSKK